MEGLSGLLKDYDFLKKERLQLSKKLIDLEILQEKYKILKEDNIYLRETCLRLLNGKTREELRNNYSALRLVLMRSTDPDLVDMAANISGRYKDVDKTMFMDWTSLVKENTDVK